MADKENAGVENPVNPPVALTPEAIAPTVAPAQAEPSPPSAQPTILAEPERTPTLLEKFDAEAKAAAATKAAERPPEAAKSAADVTKPAEAAKEAAKLAEAKAAETPKPAETETKPPEAPAKPEPVEYKYTLPETLKLDDARKTELHGAFDEFRTNPAEGSQKLIDLHNKAMTEYAEQTRRDQFKTFNDTKAGWETKWLSDNEIGGAGHRTALKAIARVRDDFVSSAQQGTPKYQQDWKDFNEFLAITGAGSHPAFARLMHNLSGYVTERQADQNPVDIKPPKDIGKQPGNFKQVMYDNPRSNSNGRA